MVAPGSLLPAHRLSPRVYRARRRFAALVAATVVVLGVLLADQLFDVFDRDDPVAAQAGPALVPAPRQPAAVSPSRPTAPKTAVPVARRPVAVPAAALPGARPDDPRLPASGSGRRVVYSISHQRVWLVDGAGSVARTYRVSGARDEYVSPGTFEVFSASKNAIAWDYKSTMRWMVRFAKGPDTNIGFHDIPTVKKTGQPVQTPAQLGIPLSDGCIRQAPPDARALFDFAPPGTRVVVTA